MGNSLGQIWFFGTNKKGLHRCSPLNMVGRTGFEPVTNWLKANCSTD